jgi:thioredoxin reductase (NADPH)
MREGGGVAQPALVIVDADRDVLAALAQALMRRFGADYRVISADTPATGLAALDRLERAGEPVALVAADQRLPGMAGVDFLSRAGERHPDAKRVVLIGYGDVTANIAGVRAMGLGRADSWLNVPCGPPELWLYPMVSDLLSQWTRSTAHAGPMPQWVRLVAPRSSRRSHELRDLLGRNNIIYGFHDSVSPEGRRLLAEAGLDRADRPVLLLVDGRVLVDPSDTQLAASMGIPTRPGSGRYDIVVIGAGPAGLAAASYTASEGLHTLLVERVAPGGQAGTTSSIRNYLGFPRGISGGELAWLATEQALMFGVDLIAQKAVRLSVTGDERVLTLADGSRAVSAMVVLATGVHYRRLPTPGLDELLGAGVFYGAAVTEATALAGRRVVVVGGANSAGQAALHLARHAERVTMLVRGSSLAASMSAYLHEELCRTDNVTVRLHTELAGVHGAGRLDAITVRDNRTGNTERLPTAAVFLLIGAEPCTDWLAGTVRRDERGFLLTGRDLLRAGRPAEDWPLDRPPMHLETSLPGVFAAGDVRHGSVKRVASAVGEGATAVQFVHQYLAEMSPAAQVAAPNSAPWNG